MTGPTRRDLENRIDDLREERGKEILVARRDLSTGDLEDFDGNPVDPDDHGADEIVILEESVVMERERAEKEGREIIGPYEDGPEGRNFVKIPVGRIESDDLPNGVTSK